MSQSIYFEDEDFVEPKLPATGWYESTIVSAQLRESAQRNLMLYILYEVHGVPPAYDRVADYFVLEGSPRAVRVSRGRLVRLFRACGLTPKSGDEIAPADLFQARLEVKIDHDAYRGRPRLRVTSYRGCGLSADEADTPF